MDLFLLGKGLAQTGHREAGRLRGIDDDLLPARQQIHSRWQILDYLGRDDDSAVPVGMDNRSATRSFRPR